MLNTIYFDDQVSDDSRREQLFSGQLFVYSPTPGSLKLIEFARKLIRDAFGSLDPLTAQRHMPVEQYAAVLAELKPKFIHHPESKKFIPEILKDLGCNLSKTYFDVPRMRTATSDDYLTTGIAYAFHPHRDTWYSAPPCQVNFWIPIYEIESGRSMAFHPHYWSHPVRNSSENYNYGEWNKTSRANAAQHIKTDTRVQPKAVEPVELERRPAALDCSQLLGKDPIQHRLQKRPYRRRDLFPRRSQRGLVVHRDMHERLSPGNRLVPRASRPGRGI